MRNLALTAFGVLLAFGGTFVAFYFSPVPLPLAERQRVIRGMAEALNRFVRAVDWEEIARIWRDAASDHWRDAASDHILQGGSGMGMDRRGTQRGQLP